MKTNIWVATVLLLAIPALSLAKPPATLTLDFKRDAIGKLPADFATALAGHMQRDLVETRRWLTKDDYLQGLALAQLAPGPLAASSPSTWAGCGQAPWARRWWGWPSSCPRS